MVSSTDSDPVGRTGARFGGGGRQWTGPDLDEPRFEHSLRGYDRAAVDAHLARHATVLVELRAALAGADRARATAVERAAAAELENAELRRAAAAPHPIVETGFGSRAEKILRMAEREASEARARAATESAALIDAARSAAEAHRHEVEQKLIGRVSRAEQTAAQLEAELVEREQQVARRIEADLDEARRVQDAAVRAAEVLRAAAGAEAEEMLLSARGDVERMREEARQELARLGGLRSDLRSDLDRLVGMLETEASVIVPGSAQSSPAEKVASVSALE